jgi:hypothetical protein
MFKGIDPLNDSEVPVEDLLLVVVVLLSGLACRPVTGVQQRLLPRGVFGKESWHVDILARSTAVAQPEKLNRIMRFRQ